MEKLEIQLHELKGGTAKQRQDYLDALKIAEKVINSEQFKQRVINYTYTYNNNLISGFKHNNGLTPKEVYILFRSGYDQFNTEKDSDIDVSATLYNKRFSSAIGYTYPSTFKTWINTKFFTGNRSKRLARIVGNIIHEACHNMGFSHAFKNNPTRPFTVPYAYGDVAHELALDYQDVDESEMKYVCYRYFYFWQKCKWVKQ